MTGAGGLRVAVLNRGSSTLKFASFVGTSAGDLVEEARGVVRVDDGVAAEDGLHEARNAMKKATTGAGPFDLVGHRVVHGGDSLCAPTLVEPWLEEEVRRWSVLAPLHNRAALGVIQAARSVFPEAAQVAVFDTAFHSTIPAAASTYALPSNLSRRPLRKFGFHGISCLGAVGAVAGHLRRPVDSVNLIICHLGAGASITAVRDGRSIDTSMGASPLQGLVMATRAGDIDIAVVDMIMNEEGREFASVLDDLQHRSGLLGLCGDADMRQVRGRADAGDRAARLAIDIYVHRILHYIGGYFAQLHQLDGLVFTGGVGEHDALLRRDVVVPLRHLGLTVDDDLNQAAIVLGAGEVHDISEAGSPAGVFVVGADEERVIAAEVMALRN